MSQRIKIGYVPIDVIRFDEALENISALIEAKKGGYVCTPNVDHLVLAETNLSFRTSYENANLSLVDGQPIVWASHLVGKALPDKISGSDLVVPLLQRAGQRGWRVYLLGGGKGVADEVAALAKARYGTNVVGTDSPKVSVETSLEENQAALQKMRAAKPDLIFIALGSPKQEVWLNKCLPGYTPAVAIGVGAAFDFLTGRAKRAPAVLSRIGLEWAFRLVSEPKRLWRRYLVNDPRFVAVLARTLLRPLSERVLNR